MGATSLSRKTGLCFLPALDIMAVLKVIGPDQQNEGEFQVGSLTEGALSRL